MAYYPPKARTWHLRDDASGITGYKRLVMLPQIVGTEATLTGASSGSAETLIKAFSSDVLDVTEIAAGTWRFALAAKVDSATDTTNIKIYCYSRDQAGTETALFNVTSAEINNTTVSSVIVTSSQTAFTVAKTDRLIVKIYAVSNSGSAKTVTLYYQGAANYSTVSIPDDIPVREGDMTKNIYDADGDGIVDNVISSLNDLTDVTITTPANGQILQYDGALWVNAALATIYAPREIVQDDNGAILTDETGSILYVEV